MSNPDMPIFSINVDFPAPGGPESPILYASCGGVLSVSKEWSISFAISRFVEFFDSTRVIDWESEARFPEHTPSNSEFTILDGIFNR